MKNTILTLTSVMALTGAANSQTVTNGSFEANGTTTTSGVNANNWSWSGGAIGFDLVNKSHTGSPSGVTGDMYLEAYDSTSLGTLSQAVSGFVIGEAYTLSFDWGNRIQGADAYDFSVGIGGQVFSQTGSGLVNMTNESLSFTAGATTETISISFNDPGVYSNTIGALDNFVITPLTVPEPSSTALLGLGALGLLIRRKR